MTDLVRRAWFWGLVEFVTVMTVFAVFAALGWPGQPDSCTLEGGNCYCEAFSRDPVPIKQVVNTWSGLLAAIGGLVILVIADRDRRSRLPPAGPMTSGGFYAVTYGVLALFLGPGSMFFHAGLTHFGGWLDNMSMVLYVSFVLLYDASRIFRFDDSKALFVVLFAAVNVLLAVLIWTIDGSGKIFFAILAVSAVIVQVVILLARPSGVRRTFVPWLLFAIVAFGIAFPIWLLSWTGGPLCDPTGFWQGHALWHLLAMAATPFFLFFYLRGETRA